MVPASIKAVGLTPLFLASLVLGQTSVPAVTDIASSIANPVATPSVAGPDVIVSIPIDIDIDADITINLPIADPTSVLPVVSASAVVSNGLSSTTGTTTLSGPTEILGTVYETVLHTITSCAPTVTNCPVGRVTPSLVPVPTDVPGHVTVYTTEYVDVCPTGITTKTYTLTQTCHEAKCQAPTTIPDQFVVTTKVCDECKGKPTITVTCPIETPTYAPYVNGTTPAAPKTVYTYTTPASPANTGCGGEGCSVASPTSGPYVITAGADRMAGAGSVLALLGSLVGVLVWGL